MLRLQMRHGHGRKDGASLAADHNACSPVELCVPWQALEALLVQVGRLGCQSFMSCMQVSCCHGVGAQPPLSCRWHHEMAAVYRYLHLGNPHYTGLACSNTACLLMLGVPF